MLSSLGRTLILNVNIFKLVVNYIVSDNASGNDTFHLLTFIPFVYKYIIRQTSQALGGLMQFGCHTTTF